MNSTYGCPARTSSQSRQIPIVFVVDDDIAVRESLELLIANEGWQARTFASAQGFLAWPRPPVPSCLVLEVRLPDLDGLELQKRVASDQRSMPIIFMTGHADISMAVRAVKAGAFEFLTKPYVGDCLLHTIRHAIERSRAALRDKAQISVLQERYDLLSRREREVMSLVVAGRLNKQVGGELGISEITVKAHRGKMMRKMQAGSFAEMVNMAASLRRGTPTFAGDIS